MASKAQRIYSAMLAAKRFRPRGWDRTGIVAIFANANGFAKLPAYSDAELSPESIAQNPRKGIRIPAEAFTRKDGGDYIVVAPDESLKISARMWITGMLPHLESAAKVAGVTVPKIPGPDDFELHLHGDGDDAYVMLYRKA